MSKNAFDNAMGELLDNRNFRQSAERQKAIILMAKMLRQWRAQAGHTQSELAENSGLPQSTIARIESPNNASLPRMETIIAFAHGCGHPAIIGTPDDFKSHKQDGGNSMAIAL